MTTATPHPLLDPWLAATALLAGAMMLGANVLGAGGFASTEFAVAVTLIVCSTACAQALNRWAMRSDYTTFIAVGLLANGARLAVLLMALGFVAFFLPIKPVPVFASVLVGSFVFLMYEVVTIHRLSVRSRVVT